MQCEFCKSENVVKFGRPTRLFRDIPRGGRPTYVKFSGQRWLCRECKKTWAKYPAGVQRWAQATDDLIGYVIKLKGLKTQKETALECGLSLRTVKKIQTRALGARKYQKSPIQKK